MVRAIPFGKLQKIWAVIWVDSIFLLFQVSLADVDILYSDSLSRNVQFNCLMFMPEISNRMVFVNGKHPFFHFNGRSALQNFLAFQFSLKGFHFISAKCLAGVIKKYRKSNLGCTRKCPSPCK